MEYFLKHKDIIVMRFSINENGQIGKIRKNKDNSNHIPIGCQLNIMKCYDWWNDRRIPKTRMNADTVLRKLGYQNTECLMVDNLALSLNDCYWICPIDSNLTWKDVSLFSNDFYDYFGEMTFDTKTHNNLQKRSPFLIVSTGGELQKKWIINDKNKRILVKGNYGNTYQQSLNEIFATELHQLQKYNQYTPYYLTEINCENNTKGIGCYSFNFCNEDIESIPAWEIITQNGMKGGDSYFYKLKKYCLDNGIKEDKFQEFMDYEIMSDFLLSNLDRHMNNIQILRDSNTLQWIGFAPIFDTGNSMFYNNLSTPVTKLKTHSFLLHEKDMLKYVKNKDILDLSKIPNRDYFDDLYSKDILFSSKEMRDILYNKFIQKYNILQNFQLGYNINNLNKKIHFIPKDTIKITKDNQINNKDNIDLD